MEKLGSARDAQLAGESFTVVPHRNDDSQDDEDSWCWKLQLWDEEGHLLSSELLPNNHRSRP